MPLASRSRYRRTSLTWPTAITTVPGSQTSARPLMSLSGSPLSDRSTIRIAGLAEIESDWTALRRPPLAHFSGAQPISMTTGRSTSSAVSSQMKAAKGSRLPARPGFQGAFMLLTPFLRGHFGQSARARRLLFAIGVDCLGRTHDHGLAGSFGALQEVLGVGDHCRDVAVDGAAEARRRGVLALLGVLVRPVGAARHVGPAAGNDDADLAGIDVAFGHRRAVAHEQAVAAGDLADILPHRDAGRGIVDPDAVAVTQVHRLEPVGPIGRA